MRALRFYLSSAIFLAVSAQPALAQEAEGPTSAVQEADADIIVTAQFRSQRLQDTPLAISAVNAATMEAKHQVSIADIATSSPSVSLTANASGGSPAVPVLTIRGVGQIDAIGGAEPGVGVYVDDVYYGILNGAVFELVDLDRVEVLRGPQGTLSGKNSEGGSIKLFSKAPDNELGGMVDLSYGSYNRSQVRASFNVPIVDEKVMLRVSGVYRHEDGYIKRLDFRCANPSATAVPFVDPSSPNHGCVLGKAGGQDLAALRASLKIVPTDGIENTIIADVTDDQRQPDAAQQLDAGAWASPYNFITAPKSYTNYAAYVGYLGTPQQYQEFLGSHVKQWGISNKFIAELGSGISLTSITAYRRTDARGGQAYGLAPYTPVLQDTEVHHKQFSQELRLSGNIGTFADVTLGAYYFKGKSLAANHVDLLGGSVPGGGLAPGLFAANILSSDPFRTESKSGFGHVVLHLADGLNLTGGLRYTSENKTVSYSRTAVDNGNVYAFNPTIVALDGFAPAPFSGNRWDWRVALDYRFSPEVLVYAQAATGFKSGGTNPRPFFPSQAIAYKPESVTTYEAGFKTDLFDRRARLNASAFYSDFSDMQLIVFSCDAISPFPGAPCFQTTNGGNSKLWGVEIEGSVRPVDGLTIDFSGSFLDFKYKSVNPGTGIALGNTLPFLVKNKFSVGAQYEFEALGGKLTPRADLTYQSKFQVDAVNQGGAANDLRGRVPGFTIVNARLNYQPSGAPWELSLNVENVFDKFYYTNKFNGYDSVGENSAVGFVGKPRVWSVSGKYKF